MSSRIALSLSVALATAIALAHGCGSGGGDGGRRGGSQGGGTSTPGTAGIPATLALTTPASGLTGDVPVDITISHPQPSATVDIEVEVSIDAGASYSPATAAPGGASQAGLAAGAGTTHRWLWSSVADLGRTDQKFVRLRARSIRPGAGAYAETTTFEVKNAALGTPFTRYPYVQRAAAGSALILWRTVASDTGTVRYGASPAALLQSANETSPTQAHMVELTGLAPGAACYYRVSDSGGAALGPVESFRVPGDASQTRIRFAVYGDSGMGNASQYEIAALMRAADPDFYLHMGDVIYPIGSATDYDPKFFDPYRENLRRAPIYPSIGNHDILSGFGSPYTDAFECFRNPNGSEKYYAFEYGNARFISLDTSLGFMIPGDAQHRWLVNELAKTGAWTWTFVFHHHPPYSGGSHGAQYQIRYLVSPSYEQYGVDVCFTGHDHNYERTKHVKDFNSGGPGVLYFVAGGAGAGLRGVNAQRYTEMIASEHHYLLVEIDGRTFKSTAYRQDGSVLDAYTFTK